MLYSFIFLSFLQLLLLLFVNKIKWKKSFRGDLKTNFEENKIEVSFPLGEGRDYDLSIDLFDKINKDNVEVKVLLNKIEIIMEK